MTSICEEKISAKVRHIHAEQMFSKILSFNPSRPDPGQREKINLKFLLSLFFVVPQKVL